MASHEHTKDGSAVAAQLLCAMATPHPPILLLLALPFPAGLSQLYAWKTRTKRRFSASVPHLLFFSSSSLSPLPFSEHGLKIGTVTVVIQYYLGFLYLTRPLTTL